MSGRFRAVLWDFGGVLADGPFDAFAAYERANQLPAGFLRRLNSTNPDTNAWARLERNELHVDDFVRAYAEEAGALGHAVDGAEVLALLAGGALRPAMLEAVRRCGEQLKTALLTNNFVPVAGAAQDRDGALTGVLSLFDVVIESSRVGVRKPDPRFYEMACDALGVTPDEAVFLDDLGINLKPARAMGMATIKVSDPAQALAELEALVGFPVGIDRAGSVGNVERSEA